MKKRLLFISLCLALSLTLITVLLVVADSSEVEPNNTSAQANYLDPADVLTGAINPVGDVDYYSLSYSNSTWGFIALLDTQGSTSSKAGGLTALGTNGTTVLQSDSGSWERGSGIALQNYADGRVPHYLRVNESGDNATISNYTLRYYKTIITAMPEVEPNETRTTGTPSSFTNSGVISIAGDIDCYAFHGRAGDTIVIALQGDPEGNGSPINPILELRSPSNTVLKSANVTGTGGKEFIEYSGLSSEGVYAYCVRAGSGTAGPTATYKVGIVRNGGLYFPGYTTSNTWLNPRPGNYALVGDTLSFRIAITNTSPLAIPGNIGLTASYSSTCLAFTSASPAVTSTSPGEVSWAGQKPSGLSAGEVYSVTFSAIALKNCSDQFHSHVGIDYYLTGGGDGRPYSIRSLTYLPLIIRRP